MRGLAYPPLYASALALQAVVVVTVAYQRLPGPLRMQFAIFWLLALGVSMLLGYNLRNASSAYRLLQWLPLVTLVSLLFLWMLLAGFKMLFVICGLGLLVGRNVLLATRRALYFDLVIAMTIFYDTIGIQQALRPWPFALAFLVALVFVLMADYSDRRLSYVRAEDADAQAALTPGLRNAGLATALVLAVSALIYFLLPQPTPLGLGIPFGDSPSAGYYASSAPAALVPGRGQLGSGDGSGARLGEGPVGYGSGNTRGSSLPGGKAYRLKAVQSEIDCASDSTDDSSGQVPGALAASDAAPPAASDLTLLYLDTDRSLYVRTHAFVILRQDGWIESPGGFVNVKSSGPFIFGRGQEADAVRQIFRVNAELEPVIPGAHRIQQVSFPAGGLGLSRDHSLIAYAPKLIRGTRYAMRSSVQYVDGRPSGGFERAVGPFAEYLQMPPELDRRLHELALGIVRDIPAGQQRAAALERHLRLNYGPGNFNADGGNALARFLFEQRVGGSAQFASSLTIMLRAAGIPSRLASGYRARRLNPLHGDFELWKSDSHCWVEAYVDNRWTIYEPSPWVPLPARQPAASAWVAAQEYVRLAKVDDAGVPVDPRQRPSDNYLRLVLAWGWTITFGPWVLLGLVLAAWIAWRYQRWLRPLLDAYDLYDLQRRRAPGERVLAAYRVLERAFGRRDMQRSAAENHAEYLSRMSESRPHLASLLLAVSSAFAVARYGVGDTSADTGEHIASTCRDIVELIDEQLPRQTSAPVR